MPFRFTLLLESRYYQIDITTFPNADLKPLPSFTVRLRLLFVNVSFLLVFSSSQVKNAKIN